MPDRMADDLDRQRELRRERDELTWTPSCPACLHRVDAVDTDHGPVWRCPACGTVLSPDQSPGGLAWPAVPCTPAALRCSPIAT